MNNILFVFTLLISLSYASNRANISPSRSLESIQRRFLDTYVTKNGNITLQKDSYGFYFEVDLSDHPSDASDSAYDPYKVNMTVGLYTSQTLLSSQPCLNYNTYDCSNYQCYNYTWATSLDFPYLSMQGFLVETRMYLDYSNWHLVYYANVANYCFSQRESTFGSYRYGIVGLGWNYTENNYNNYLSSDIIIISIYLNQNATSGTLLFGIDSNIRANSSYIATLSADVEFHVNATYFFLSVGSSTISFNAKLIFDLDSDAIGLPYTIYNDVLQYLQTYSVSCVNTTYYKPLCLYAGNLTDLPTITLELQGFAIPIPPQIYVQDFSTLVSYYLGGSHFALNFKGLSSSFYDESYVTPAFENYVILDQNFMSYYTTQFTGSPSTNNYTISIYNPNPTSSPNSSGSQTWIYIVAGSVVGAIIIIGIACYCCKRSKRIRRQRNGNKIVSVEEPSEANIREPLNNTQQDNTQYQYNMYPPNYPQNIQGQYIPQPYGNQPGMPQPGAYPYNPQAQWQGYGYNGAPMPMQGGQFNAGDQQGYAK